MANLLGIAARLAYLPKKTIGFVEINRHIEYCDAKALTLEREKSTRQKDSNGRGKQHGHEMFYGKTGMALMISVQKQIAHS